MLHIKNVRFNYCGSLHHTLSLKIEAFIFLGSYLEIKWVKCPEYDGKEKLHPFHSVISVLGRMVLPSELFHKVKCICTSEHEFTKRSNPQYRVNKNNNKKN